MFAQFQTVDWRWLVAMLVIEFVRRVIGGLRWTLAVSIGGVQLTPALVAKHLRVFFLSNLAAYAPGGIWGGVLRVELNKLDGVSRIRTGAALFVDTMLILLTSLATGSYYIVYQLSEQRILAVLIPCVAVVGLIFAAHPRFVAWLLKLASRPGLVSETWGRNVMLILFALAAKLLSGAALCMGLLALGASFDYWMMFEIVSLYAIAWAIGMVSIWAPAGLGMREGVLVWGLASSLTMPIVLSVAALARVSTLLPDIILGAAAMLHLVKPRPS